MEEEFPKLVIIRDILILLRNAIIYGERISPAKGTGTTDNELAHAAALRNGHKTVKKALASVVNNY